MKTCAALLALVCLLLAGCDGQTTVYPDPQEAFLQRRWVQAMTDEVESALRKIGKPGDVPGDVVMCIHTSAPVSDLDIENLGFYFEHIQNIAAAHERALTLLIGAAEVKWEGRYEGSATLAAGSPARLALAWRGGGEAEDFRGLLRRAGALNPALIVTMANGHGILPAAKPPAPVVWLRNQPCWTGPQRENYDPACLDLEEFGAVISIRDSMLDGAR